MISFNWSIYFVTLILLCEGRSYENVATLRSTLLSAPYNPDIIPLNDQTAKLNINLTLYLFMISDVDQVQGSLTMGVMVTQEWFDEKLTWDPDAYDGITNISIKSEDMWTPPLTVANPVKFTMLDKSWMPVVIQSNGRAMYTVGEIISTTCSFYMEFWPFDKQICPLHLFVYGHSSEILSLSVPGTIVNADCYTKNGEWSLDTDSFTYSLMDMFGSTQVVYSFKIARLPSFYLLTVIMPVNSLGALTCLVFILPSESGERVSYSITVMLSLAVFLTVTAQELPKNSEPVPIMCTYILFNMVVCVCALIFVILNLKVYHRSASEPIARYYKAIVRLSCCHRNRNKVMDILPQNSKKKKGSFSVSKEKMQGKIFVPPPKVELEQSDVSFECREITWKMVSEAIDKILFYSLIILTYVPSIIILIYIALASDYVPQ